MRYKKVLVEKERIRGDHGDEFIRSRGYSPESGDYPQRASGFVPGICRGLCLQIGSFLRGVERVIWELFA